MARILMVVAPERFRDEELFDTRDALEAAGHQITVASTRLGQCPGSRGGHVIADIVVTVSSGLSVSEAHAICEQARQAVINATSMEVMTYIRFRPDDNLMGLEASLDLPGSHA